MLAEYTVIVKLDEDGRFVMRCPDLPGCISEGNTPAEARTNMTDAIRGYLESLRKHGEEAPPPIAE